MINDQEVYHIKNKQHYSQLKYYTLAKFITNIQLQDADRNDYDVLYKELEKESFKSEKHETKRNTYVADKEVFSLEGDITLQDVNDAVFRASSKTGRKYSFFVIRHKKYA